MRSGSAGGPEYFGLSLLAYGVTIVEYAVCVSIWSIERKDVAQIVDGDGIKWLGQKRLFAHVITVASHLAMSDGKEQTRAFYSAEADLHKEKEPQIPPKKGICMPNGYTKSASLT